MPNKINKKKGGQIEVKKINLVSKYFLAHSLIATKHGGGGKTGIDYNIILTDPEVFDVLAESEDISIEMITISYKDEILFNGRVETMYIDIFIDDIKYESVRLVKNKNKSGSYIIHKKSHKFIMSVNILSSQLNESVTYVAEKEEEEIEYLIEDADPVEQEGGENKITSKLKQLSQKGGKVINEWKEKSYLNKHKSAGYFIDAAWIATGIATAYYILKRE